MFRHMLKSKIRNAIITETQLKYCGSIGIDKNILKKVNILPGEKVQVLNINNGERLETYVIEEEKTNTIKLYGPAARKGEVGDKLIIISYMVVEDKEIGKIENKILDLENLNKE